MIRSVAVIGAGDRGRAFALRCAQYGFETVLQDVLPSKLRKAEAQLAEAATPVRGQLRLVTSIEDAVREADVAIDFVPDELESKLEIFSLLDRMAPPKTLLCTPTKLSISDLASCTYRAERCAALVVEPAEGQSEAELVLGRETTMDAADLLSVWLTGLGLQVRTRAESLIAITEGVCS